MKDFCQNLDRQHDLPKLRCQIQRLFKPLSKSLNPHHNDRLPPKPSHDKANCSH